MERRWEQDPDVLVCSPLLEPLHYTTLLQVRDGGSLHAELSYWGDSASCSPRECFLVHARARAPPTQLLRPQTRGPGCTSAGHTGGARGMARKQGRAVLILTQEHHPLAKGWQNSAALGQAGPERTVEGQNQALPSQAWQGRPHAPCAVWA